MRNGIIIRISYLALIFFFSRCTKEKGVLDPCYKIPANYSTDIEPVISANCSLSGCHTPGFASGDFTTYEGVKLKIDNGNFNRMVFDLKLMPPPSSPLNEDELKKIQCWINNGAPDN